MGKRETRPRSEIRASDASSGGADDQEAGCVRYTVHRSVINASEFVTIEYWTSKGAVDHHFATPHVQALLKKSSRSAHAATRHYDV